ncbi:MAG: 3-dehydroquinate synthase family protein, partial [Acidimicrobiia bacterium]|nr:3-dehydroquinate synthase family protein [Acidimicrobiia bacterium]
CAIDVGRGLATAEQLLLPDQDRVGVLTQASVAPLAEHIAAEAREQGVTAAVRMLPDGDAAKNLGTVETVYEWLNSLGFTRSDQIVAVGGGALTDLSGFVAATYLRGVEVTYLPTTLLGAVDAAVGGKTGVNVGGKNLAGVFRHPARIVVDLDILDALPEQLLREGAAETVKAGFIRDAAIVSEYERAGIAASLEIVVPAAIAVKVDTVTADFTEQGQRAILNYGHTIGHAVEVAAGISHGEAVAIGMVAAGRVSEIVLGFGEAQRQRDIIASIGLPVTAPAVDIDQVAVLMGRDKKRDRDGIRMVLLEEFGSPVLRHVEPGVIDEALAVIGVL